jgi:hypothetical protein
MPSSSNVRNRRLQPCWTMTPPNHIGRKGWKAAVRATDPLVNAKQRSRESGDASMTDDKLELDAMTAAPEHHEILMENDQVRVLDTRLGSGERTPVHTHRWPATLYVMSWSCRRIRRDAATPPPRMRTMTPRLSTPQSARP